MNQTQGDFIMSLSYAKLHNHVVALFGAVAFAAVMISAAVPVVPVA